MMSISWILQRQILAQYEYRIKQAKCPLTQREPVAVFAADTERLHSTAPRASARTGLGLAVMIALTLAGVSLSGCTSRHRATSSTRGSASAPLNIPSDSHVAGDDDTDEDTYSRFDDASVRAYGHRATTAEKEAVATLVKRYYADLATENGWRACTLTNQSIAHDPNLIRIDPSDYRPDPGTPSLRGKSCAYIVRLLSRQHHREFNAAYAEIGVVELRVSDEQGLATLGFLTTPERVIAVEQDHGKWTVDALFDKEIP